MGGRGGTCIGFCCTAPSATAGAGVVVVATLAGDVGLPAGCDTACAFLAAAMDLRALAMKEL